MSGDGRTGAESGGWVMLFEPRSNRLYELLCWVGYSVEFPKYLASRIGGHPVWCRKVTCCALRDGYLELCRKETPGQVVLSLRITEKGLEYIAVRSPENYMMIMARMQEFPRTSRSHTQRILRLHSFAAVMLMAHRAGALVLPKDKPPLTLRGYGTNRVPSDPDTCYFYSTAEIRTAIQEYAPEIAAKGSRIAGVLVHGSDCFCIYDAGRTRIFWMRSTEENFAGTVLSLLNLRGFRVSTLRQIMLGDRIGVAARLCRRGEYGGTRYFVLSSFFSSCCFVTNDTDGERQMRALWDPAAAEQYRRRALSGCILPELPTREYDAIDRAEQRPVIINYMCDLLRIPELEYAPAGFAQPPIIRCFDHQAAVLQQLVGSMAEVRGMGGTGPDDRT